MYNFLLSRQKRFISLCLAGLFLFQQSQAFASQVSTSDLLNELDHSTPFFTPQQRLAMQQDIVKKMQDAGVVNNDLQQRVAALSDQDLQLLQTRFDEEAAGGDIVGAVIFVFLVLLITDIIGLTDVFPFVHHHHHPNRGHHKHDLTEQP